MGSKICVLGLFVGFLFVGAAAEADSKKQIEEIIFKVEKSPQDPDLQVDLAVAYLRDQQLEQAFRSYLGALEKVPLKQEELISDEEQALYSKALNLYLANNSGPKVQEAAQQLKSEFGSVVEKHPDFLHLNFLVAAAYANTGQFEEFFRRFYQSYKKNPNSYMGDRTKAILHLKLYERAKTPSDREKQRKAIVEFVKRASEKNRSDTSLYKLTLTFSSEGELPNAVRETIERIIADNIQIARSEIPFYVSKAVDTSQKPLAQKFLNKAKEWYSYSQIIEKSQKYIDQ